MYRITINEKILKTTLNVEDAFYWQRRLTEMFPQAIVGIVMVKL